MRVQAHCKLGTIVLIPEPANIWADKYSFAVGNFYRCLMSMGQIVIPKREYCDR